MKLAIMRAIRLTILMILPSVLIAQESKDYNVLLNSGKFIPNENIVGLTRSSQVFIASKSGDRHYVSLQFKSIPTNDDKERLKSAGIQLGDYIPNYSFTATLNADFNIDVLKSADLRSVFVLSAAQKSVPALLRGEYPPHALKAPGFVDLTIITYELLPVEKLATALMTYGATIVENMPMFRSLVIRVPLASAKNIPSASFIQWAEFVDPPNQLENLLGRSLHRVNTLQDGVRNLKGDGIKIGIWDENEVGNHLDFLPSDHVNIMEPTGNASTHSTHCGGTLTSRGLIDPRAKGMAPHAQLYSYNFSGNIQTEMANAIPTWGLNVSSHSYGSTQTCGLNGAGVTYSTTSRNTDLNLNNFPNHLHVHSSGNSQGACPGGWSTITASGKSAKNNILVANISTSEALSGSSSCGPVQDGRVKPEISAFGSNVFSTYPNNVYATISGTSMATPGVAGSVALLVQRYKQINAGIDPPSTLIKNTILNTAQDLGNPGPDYRFGYGRIDALSAVRILEENRYSLSSINNGVSTDVTINVPAGAARIRVMLTWNDPAGTANANPALVNNLDLTVINGVTTTLPWILDPNNPGSIAVKAVDNVSNIEQVTIENPPAGVYTLRVTGTTVPVGPQQYALTWSVDQPYIEITYPNGAESLNPNSSETITWNNAGVTGAQTVQYSLDNGANWTTISSSVPAATTRLAWTVPAGNTSIALVRVSSGSITDVSDATFKILGTPTGFTTNAASCNSGELTFTWNPVTDATVYDIYTIDAALGQWVILASNIAATTYVATGLTPAANMWFTIVARNTTTGSVSERAVAINRTVSSGGVGSIGSITGQNNICGTPSGVMYTVPAVAGATTYTWGVPPNAVIASGQGTNTIMVDYPATAANGNVTVFATAGVCQTATANLPVTVSSTAVSAPTSGGDQTQFYCSPNPVPTLTATATVPAGHTVVWYDAATNGNVVASPTWNSVGTITYYAASVNNTNNCESNLRTPVILTINTSPNASISAGGVTTFCEGGNVVLTANAGSSYLWSNGATSQAITVSTAGSYSVTVNQPGGCSSTSAPVNVVVNARPTATVDASGPTAFCQGSSVVLTASAGASWLWSNGATTQSITVNSSGNYSVTVTGANGCTNASAATAVDVSPSPVVTITASPYTRLYPGLTTTLTANVSPAGTYTYVWFKNGVIVSAATSPTLLVNIDELGSYTVRVTNAGGCNGLSLAKEIADSSSRRLFIYPNPNTGQFQVSFHTTGQTVITIFDSKGSYVFRKDYTVNIPYQRMEVDMRKFGKGVYQVVLSDRNGKRLATGGVVIQ